MGKDDARKFDHNTLEALRMRAVQVGEKALRLSRASLLGVTERTMYGWLALYRRGSVWRYSDSWSLQEFLRQDTSINPLFFGRVGCAKGGTRVSFPFWSRRA